MVDFSFQLINISFEIYNFALKATDSVTELKLLAVGSDCRFGRCAQPSGIKSAAATIKKGAAVRTAAFKVKP